MLDLPEICVVGRANFGNGIAAITYAMCEMLARSFPICILPTEEFRRKDKSVCLPNGRIVPVIRDKSAVKIWIFCDVLWNGAYDANYNLVPETGLRIAYVVFDSNLFPPEWTRILNTRFDLALVTSPHLADIAKASGVDIPLATLPIALDLEPLLARPFQTEVNAVTRFLCLAAFHPRKEAATLIRAFATAFGARQDVELVLHSNLAFGDHVDELKRIIAATGTRNIQLNLTTLSDAKKNHLIESADIFVNLSRGEGYSIGPREALAVGKPLVLSGVGGHLDLQGLPGVHIVPATRRVPARYPEIDNRVFGQQYAVDVADAAAVLREALSLAQSGFYTRTAPARRRAAAAVSFTRMAGAYAEIINPALAGLRRAPATPLPAAWRARVQQKLGPAASALSHNRHRVVQMHDGGFFSIFNTFFSHMVWDLGDHRRHRTLPDWDVGRMIARAGTNRFGSFCYGRPEDGNIWNRIFEPLYGLSEADMNDADFLYKNATVPEALHNEDREPLLTYVNAYGLYRWKEFPAWRRQYHKVYRDHVRLLPEHQTEIDHFAAANFGDKYMLAAHVRHAGHAIEQPKLAIAQTQTYIDNIRGALARAGIDPASDGWGVFLATDQERVVRQFEDAFGSRVSYFRDVRRTVAAEDAAFDALTAEDKKKEGFQVQHIVAADPSSWSTRMAWEVIRDALAMARCRALFHVVSNVSTAVSYMNPDIELIFTT